MRKVSHKFWHCSLAFLWLWGWPELRPSWLEEKKLAPSVFERCNTAAFHSSHSFPLSQHLRNPIWQRERLSCPLRLKCGYEAVLPCQKHYVYAEIERTDLEHYFRTLRAQRKNRTVVCDVENKGLVVTAPQCCYAAPTNFVAIATFLKNKTAWREHRQYTVIFTTLTA